MSLDDLGNISGSRIISPEKASARSASDETFATSAAQSAWSAHNASNSAHTIFHEAKQHPLLATALAAAPITLMALGFNRMIGELTSGVRTADRLRTLVRIDGYGGRNKYARMMEGFVSSCRDKICDGELSTGSAVRKYIAESYLPYVHGMPAKYRDYREALMLSKHLSYADRFDSLLNGATQHTAEAEINGKPIRFITTRKSNYWDHVSNKRVNTEWLLPQKPEVFEAADTRIDQLFKEVIVNSGQRTPAAMSSNIQRVAEMEWLNAQLWRYYRGSAGVSQLQARAWLEAAGIDSGRYKAGVDPNLEALARPLADFKAAYPTFFETPPKYFEQGGLERVPSVEHSVPLPRESKLAA